MQKKVIIWITAVILTNTAPSKIRSEQFMNALGDRFHIGNKSYNQVKEIWGETEKKAAYELAVSKFPEISSCTDDLNDQPIIIADRIGTEQEAEICLFHIAEYFGTARMMADYLTQNGFEGISIRNIFGEDVADGELTIYGSFAQTAQKNLIGASGDNRKTRRLSIGISYDENSKPISANVTPNP